MNAFDLLSQSLWKCTQGDIRGRVLRIGAGPVNDLPQDETTMEIRAGLDSGVPPDVFAGAMELFRGASMATSASERAHGYGARLVEDHK
eukprot:4865247-Pyramimonas_sp.AAC.1